MLHDLNLKKFLSGNSPCVDHGTKSSRETIILSLRTFYRKGKLGRYGEDSSVGFLY